MRNRLGKGDLKEIHDLAAALAYQMGVGRNIGVKMLLPIDDSHGLDQTGGLLLGEIAIDRSKTEIRIIGVELMVDPIGSGM